MKKLHSDLSNQLELMDLVEGRVQRVGIQSEYFRQIGEISLRSWAWVKYILLYQALFSAPGCLSLGWLLLVSPMPSKPKRLFLDHILMFPVSEFFFLSMLSLKASKLLGLG